LGDAAALFSVSRAGEADTFEEISVANFGDSALNFPISISVTVH